jgi:hypothetical protein
MLQLEVYLLSFLTVSLGWKGVVNFMFELHYPWRESYSIC